MRSAFALLALTARLAAQQQSMPGASVQGVISPAGRIVLAPGFGQEGAVGAGRPQVPVKTDCAADGYVVNAVTGEPIPRAHVTLMGGYGQSSVAADNSGHWSFSNVACAP